MKKYYKNIIILFIAIVIVLYFSLRNDFNTVISELVKVNISFILIAFLLMGVSWLLRSIVLFKLVRNFKENFSLKMSFHVHLIVQFFNAVTPFASGGQPGTVYILNKKGLQVRDGTNVIIQESIIFQFSFVLITIMAIILNNIFDIFPRVTLLQNLVLLGIIVNTTVMSLLLFVSFCNKDLKIKVVNGFINFFSRFKIIKQKEKLKEKFVTYVDDFNEGAKFLLKNKKELVLKIFFMSAATIIRYMVPFVFLVAVLNTTNINIAYVVIGTIFVSIVGTYIPTPGAMGGLEFAFMQYFTVFTTGGALTAVMLLWRFATYYMGLILGGIAFALFKPNKEN